MTANEVADAAWERYRERAGRAVAAGDVRAVHAAWEEYQCELDAAGVIPTLDGYQYTKVQQCSR